MYYNARYYDPLIGRFTTADTIIPNPGDPQAFNRYTYVTNNPLRYTDPTGHQEEPIPTPTPQNNTSITTDISSEPTPEPNPGVPYWYGAEVVNGQGNGAYWCGNIGPCPIYVPRHFVFNNDEQAIAYLDFLANGPPSLVVDFLDAGMNSSDELWVHYVTRSGNSAVRWAPGLGWIRKAGLSAEDAQSLGRGLKGTGTRLLVVGAVLDGMDQWQDDAGYSTGIRAFRTVTSASLKTGATYAGATLGASGMTAYCTSTLTAGCGGLIGTFFAVGAASVIMGLLAHKVSDIVVERMF